MAIKHISGVDSSALCGIKVRSGSDRWNNKGENIYRGSVNNVVLVQIDYESHLGMNGILCQKCVKKWKVINAR